MRSILAGLRTLVIPWGAGPTDARVVINGTSGRIEIYSAGGAPAGIIDGNGFRVLAGTDIDNWTAYVLTRITGTESAIDLRPSDTADGNAFAAAGIVATYNDETDERAVLSLFAPQKDDIITPGPPGIQLWAAGNTVTTTQCLLGADEILSDGDHRITGTLRVEGAAMAPAEDEEPANDTTTSTTYTAGTAHGVAFTAPPSGSILATLSGWIGGNAVVLRRVLLSFEVRTGSSIGGGSVQTAASDEWAVSYDLATATAGFKYITGARRKIITGLTPGSSYHLRSLFKGSAADFTTATAKRTLTVEAVL